MDIFMGIGCGTEVVVDMVLWDDAVFRFLMIRMIKLCQSL